LNSIGWPPRRSDAAEGDLSRTVIRRPLFPALDQLIAVDAADVSVVQFGEIVGACCRCCSGRPSDLACSHRTDLAVRQSAPTDIVALRQADKCSGIDPFFGALSQHSRADFGECFFHFFALPGRSLGRRPTLEDDGGLQVIVVCFSGTTPSSQSRPRPFPDRPISIATATAIVRPIA